MRYVKNQSKVATTRAFVNDGSKCTVYLVMGSKFNELDRFIRAIFTVRAFYDLMIAPGAACPAVKINNQKVFSHRATVKAPQVAPQRLPKDDRVLNNGIDLPLDCLSQGAEFPQRLHKSVAEQDLHLKTSS